jgi:hypothetical protein
MFHKLTRYLKSWSFGLRVRLPRQDGVQYRADHLNYYIERTLTSLDKYAQAKDWENYFKLADRVASSSFAFRCWAFIRSNPTWWVKYGVAKMERIILMSFHPRSLPLPRRVWLPQPDKPQGRPLTVACEAQRLYECLLNKLYEPFWKTKLNTFQFGRKGVIKAWQSALPLLRIAPAMLTFDYSKFYDKIDFENLINSLKSCYGLSPYFLNYLNHLRCTPMCDSPNRLGEGRYAHSRITGLPQGSPLSPVLSLLCLELLGVYQGAYQYLGYMDDGLLFTAEKEDRVRSSFESNLALGVEVKPNSDQYYRLDRPHKFTFLGLEYDSRKTHVRFTIRRRSGAVGNDLPTHFTSAQYAKAYAPASSPPYSPLPSLKRCLRSLNSPFYTYFYPTFKKPCFLGPQMSTPTLSGVRALGNHEGYKYPKPFVEVFLKSPLFYQPSTFYTGEHLVKHQLLLLTSLSSFKLEYFLTSWGRG